MAASSMVPHYVFLLLVGFIFSTIHCTSLAERTPSVISVHSRPDGDELTYSRRALLVLKDTITPPGMLDLLASDIASSNAAWHAILANSSGTNFVPAITEVKAEVSSKVMNATTFLAWFNADTGNPNKMIGAHPEHYIESETHSANGSITVNICETWGSLITHYTLPNYGPGPKQPYMKALTQYPFQAVAAATLMDGTVFAHVHNSFRDIPHGKDGIEAQLAVWLPSSTPDDVVQELKNHQSIEFTNWLKFAVADIESGAFKP